VTQKFEEEQQMNALKNLALALLGTLAFAAQSQATTVLFDDNFDANAVLLNGTPTGWTTFQGSVDIIGPGLYDLLPGNGSYIDMDGSTSAEGGIHTNQSFTMVPGETYELSYSLAGAQRSDGSNTIEAYIPGALAGPPRTLADSVGFGTVTETSFTVSAPTTAQIFFRAITGISNDQGLLLDNVKFTSVPLPAAVWLMLSGIAGLGAFARRRRAGGALAT
jgi:hypothetical protein